MARNRSTNRRRRRGRFSFLTKFLCILLIAGAVVAALTIFFKVQSITVSGNARYTSEEVVAASGIEIEDNLFLLNKYSAAQAIFEKLPYVEEATINRALPDTIVITVRECAAAAGVVTPEGYWLISENGKLLERTDTLPSGCPGITGVEPESPALSAQLSLGEEKTLTTETLLTLVRTAGGYGMLAGHRERRPVRRRGHHLHLSGPLHRAPPVGLRPRLYFPQRAGSGKRSGVERDGRD